MKINFNEWDDYDNESKYDEDFNKFLNQSIAIPPDGISYARNCLLLDNNISKILKKYIKYNNLNYYFIHKEYDTVFYAYLRIDMKGHLNIEFLNNLRSNFNVINLIIQ